MSNTTTYKQTPIGLIPTDWEVKMIKEIGDVSSGGTPDTNNLKYWDGNINWCTPTDITALTNKFLGNTITKITEEGLKNSSAKILPPNSIIVCTRATIGKAAINTVPMSTNQGFKNIVPKNIDTNFLYYKIISEEKGFIKIANGSTFLEVSKTDFDNFNISIPPLPEQQKIAQILSTWDAAIDNCKAIIHKLQERNKGLAQQLLTGKMRVKGFEKTKWNEKKLGDVFKERNECNQNALQLLSIGERGVYPQDEDNKRDISNSDKSKYKKICVGDIGYNTMRMWQGRCAKSNYEGIVSPAYTIVFCKTNHFVNFYAHLFKLPFMMHKFFRVSQGLVEDTLNCKYNDFSIVSVNIPNDIEEQKAIVHILDTATAELNQYQQKIQTLHQQKKGLMQQLLTGKTRVKI